MWATRTCTCTYRVQLYLRCDLVQYRQHKPSTKPQPNSSITHTKNVPAKPASIKLREHALVEGTCTYALTFCSSDSTRPAPHQSQKAAKRTREPCRQYLQVQVCWNVPYTGCRPIELPRIRICSLPGSNIRDPDPLRRYFC